MFVVGITGGIGSGKTAVSDRFKRLGIKVVDADIASREVVKPGQPALAVTYASISAPTSLQADGALDRAKLRARVFAEPDERKWLERLLHPKINAYLQRELANAESPYAILVSPLMMETGQARFAASHPSGRRARGRSARAHNGARFERREAGARRSWPRNRLARSGSQDADDVIVNDAGARCVGSGGCANARALSRTRTRKHGADGNHPARIVAVSDVPKARALE